MEDDEQKLLQVAIVVVIFITKIISLF